MPNDNLTSFDALRVGALVHVPGFKEYGRILKLYPDGLADVQFNIRIEAKHLKRVTDDKGRKR
jgi:hypothetical protein